jgi:hypothetical protein
VLWGKICVIFDSTVHQNVTICTDPSRCKRRLITVDPNSREPQADFHRLYYAYQEAWKQFRAEVGVWQSLLSEAADEAAIKEAKNRAARAEASYREQRNKLADYLIARSVNPQIGNALLSPAHLANSDTVRDTRKALDQANSC